MFNENTIHTNRMPVKNDLNYESNYDYPTFKTHQMDVFFYKKNEKKAMFFKLFAKQD